MKQTRTHLFQCNKQNFIIFCNKIYNIMLCRSSLQCVHNKHKDLYHNIICFNIETLSYPLYELLRKEIWPDHTPVAHKLYGSLEDLRCTREREEILVLWMYCHLHREDCSFHLTNEMKKKKKKKIYNNRERRRRKGKEEGENASMRNTAC